MEKKVIKPKINLKRQQFSDIHLCVHNLCAPAVMPNPPKAPIHKAATENLLTYLSYPISVLFLPNNDTCHLHCMILMTLYMATTCTYVRNIIFRQINLLLYGFVSFCLLLGLLL